MQTDTVKALVFVVVVVVLSLPFIVIYVAYSWLTYQPSRPPEPKSEAQLKIDRCGASGVNFRSLVNQGEDAVRARVPGVEFPGFFQSDQFQSMVTADCHFYYRAFVYLPGLRNIKTAWSVDFDIRGGQTHLMNVNIE